MGNFKEDIARTEAFVFDVDGVMTDGGIIPTLDGDFIRRYNAKDGYALAYAIKMGYKVCIITGGRGKTLENRLKMLGVTRAYIDCMDKISALHEYFAEEGIDPRNAIYMGDDIPDLECMREVGIPDVEICPDKVCDAPFSRFRGEFAPEDLAMEHVVRPSDVDMGHHMNNTAYVRALLDTFTVEELLALRPAEFEICFRQACFGGDTLTLRRQTQENGFRFAVLRPDGKDAALAQMLLK